MDFGIDCDLLCFFDLDVVAFFKKNGHRINIFEYCCWLPFMPISENDPKENLSRRPQIAKENIQTFMSCHNQQYESTQR